jgi:hypothetical protein
MFSRVSHIRAGMITPTKDATRFFETELDDEIVLMNVETGSFHALKGASVEIWSRIDGVRTAEMIAAELVERYEVEPDHCTSDVTSFLGDLAQAGFVVSR